jgi:E3 ubiquitin-protein ligase DOA10
MLEIILIYSVAILIAAGVFVLSSYYRKNFMYRNMDENRGVAMHGNDIDKNLKIYFGRLANRPIKRRSIGSP